MTWAFAIAYMAWVLLSAALYTGLDHPVVQWAWLILKWPAFIAPLLGWWSGVRQDGNPWLNTLLLAFNLWLWWQCRNDGDDDFRKKLGQRIAAKVQAAGHRLVVVPT